MVMEVISPSTRSKDRVLKLNKYMDNSVREYWIVDPERQRTTIYRYEEDAAPMILPFSTPVASGICPDFSLVMAGLL